jgi:V8-like Glu-specific endopeptidase
MDLTITPEKVYIPAKYFDKSNSIYEKEEGNGDYDYAIITVEEDLSNYINFDLGVARSTAVNKEVLVTGFGLSVKTSEDETAIENANNQYLLGNKSTSKGILYKEPSESAYRLFHTADTIGGDSGAPLYVSNTDNNTVIGINAYSPEIEEDQGCNKATRITTDILNLVYNHK